MRVVTTIKEMQALIQMEKSLSKSIGYVPTMGFLHEGHISLIKKAREHNDIVVISIFVNPLQFGPTEDLDAYPRDFDRDRELAQKEGVDYIFYPSVQEMYPKKLSANVVVRARTNVLCGKSRPGHFDGVATVLTKLFHTVLPDRAYFGMKDAQQVAVVDGLITDFNFPVELIPVETVREEDELAKSSRNVNLSEEERLSAPALYKSLSEARKLIEEGEREAKTIINYMRTLIEEETAGVIDYIEILSFPELEEVVKIEGKIIIALAVQFQRARLIDNMVITVD